MTIFAAETPEKGDSQPAAPARLREGGMFQRFNRGGGSRPDAADLGRDQEEGPEGLFFLKP